MKKLGSLGLNSTGHHCNVHNTGDYSDGHLNTGHHIGHYMGHSHYTVHIKPRKSLSQSGHDMVQLLAGDVSEILSIMVTNHFSC